MPYSVMFPGTVRGARVCLHSAVHQHNYGAVAYCIIPALEAVLRGSLLTLFVLLNERRHYLE